MPVITGKTTQKPSKAYWYWTTLGPKNIDLTDKKKELPPGEYELHWDFRGNPGESLEFTITGPKGKQLAKVSQKLAAGKVDGWGLQAFNVDLP